ncbi:unnamed protein product [Camellia sinensis]
MAGEDLDLMESILKVVEDDNDKSLHRHRDRTDRVGIEIPMIEVRYERLSIEGDVYVGSRALPTLFNATLNAVETMTLLLGPPGAGKTTLLLGLAGKLDKNLR